MGLWQKVQEAFVQHQKHAAGPAFIQNLKKQWLIRQFSRRVIGIAQEHHANVLCNLLQDILLYLVSGRLGQPIVPDIRA